MSSFDKNRLFLRIEPYLYLLPGLVLFALFVFFPFFKTIYLSMHITDPLGRAKDFIGLVNYINLFKSQSFLNTLIVSIEFVVIVVLFSITGGFILALFANIKIKGVGIFRTIYALPMAISAAAASEIWRFIFHPVIGIMKYITRLDINWLTDSKWALIAVAIVTIWMNLGINYIFIIAGLQNVPEELYEAASIDGAGTIRKHWSITIPSIAPILFFLLIIGTIDGFQTFTQIKVLTQGGPGEATNVLVYAIYRDAFFNNRFGVACGKSVILFIILLILTFSQSKQFRFMGKGNN